MIPEARDLETPLEVSIWAWNWMEVSAYIAVILIDRSMEEEMKMHLYRCLCAILVTTI